ncbi:virulence RhuM family protein [Acidithiobacillus sp. MC6.1]|nr:virulence RhuM family protein [Acidithiobacillus sp. MC6.1]
MNDLILNSTEDGRSQINLRARAQTVWLTQLEMAELFDATKQNISLHLKNIFEDEELAPAATVKESLTVQIEGSREVQRPVTLYNLDAILAVGYRVRQGGHHIDEAVIRRRFSAGRRNLDQAYKAAVDTWVEYDDVGEEPTLLQWGENR